MGLPFLRQDVLKMLPRGLTKVLCITLVLLLSFSNLAVACHSQETKYKHNWGERWRNMWQKFRNYWLSLDYVYAEGWPWSHGFRIKSVEIEGFENLEPSDPIFVNIQPGTYKFKVTTQVWTRILCPFCEQHVLVMTDWGDVYCTGGRRPGWYPGETYTSTLTIDIPEEVSGPHLVVVDRYVKKTCSSAKAQAIHNQDYLNNKTIALLNISVSETPEEPPEEPPGENKAPVFGEIEDIVLEEDSVLENALNVYEHVSDPDQDEVHVEILENSNQEILVELDGNGNMRVEPEENYHGYGLVTLIASDGKNNSTKIIKTVVKPVNDAPSFLSLPTIVLDEDDTLENALDLSQKVYDVDNENTDLSFTIVENAEAKVTATLGSSMLSVAATTPNYNGETTIVLGVSDGELEDTATLTIQVEGVNDPPVLGPIPSPVSVHAGQSYTISATASDPDDEEITMFYTGWKTTPEFETTCEDIGEHKIKVKAKDPHGAYDYQYVTIRVYNNPPNAPSTQSTQGHSLTPTISWTSGADPDQDQVKTRFELLPGLLDTQVEGETYAVPAGKIQYDGLEKPYVYRLTAVDECGEESNTVSAEYLLVNHPPSIKAPTLTPAQPTAGTTLTCIQGAASDPDQDTVTTKYEWYINQQKQQKNTPTLTTSGLAPQTKIHCSTTPSDQSLEGTEVNSNQVELEAENTAPVLNLPEEVQVYEDADEENVLNLAEYVSDAEEDEIEFSVQSNSNPEIASATIDSENNLDVALPTQDANGYTLVTIQASDGQLTDTDSLKITVIPVNDPPSITPPLLSPQQPVRGELLNCVKGTTSDPDQDNVTTKYEWYINQQKQQKNTPTLTTTSIKPKSKIVCSTLPSDQELDGTEIKSNEVTLASGLELTINDYPETVEYGENVTIEFSAPGAEQVSVEAQSPVNQTTLIPTGVENHTAVYTKTRFLGTVVFYVSANDSAKSISETINTTVVDTTPPILNVLTENNSTGYTRKDIVLLVNAVDNVGVKRVWANISGQTKNMTSTGDGNYYTTIRYNEEQTLTITYWAEDESENKNQSEPYVFNMIKEELAGVGGSTMRYVVYAKPAKPKQQEVESDGRTISFHYHANIDEELEDLYVVLKDENGKEIFRQEISEMGSDETINYTLWPGMSQVTIEIQAQSDVFAEVKWNQTIMLDPKEEKEDLEIQVASSNDTISIAKNGEKLGGIEIREVGEYAGSISKDLIKGVVEKNETKKPKPSLKEQEKMFAQAGLFTEEEVEQKREEIKTLTQTIAVEANTLFYNIYYFLQDAAKTITETINNYF